jgi:hypothetical protein
MIFGLFKKNAKEPQEEIKELHSEFKKILESKIAEKLVIDS